MKKASTKAMKKMSRRRMKKAMKVSIIAGGRLAKVQVFTGRKTRTVGGLKKSNLEQARTCGLGQAFRCVQEGQAGQVDQRRGVRSQVLRHQGILRHRRKVQ